MKNVTRILTISILTTLLVFFGISKYERRNRSKEQIYMTHSVKPAGVMIFGGMATDKGKIESFKKNLEEDDESNKYWNHLYLATDYEEQGNLELAILESEKALEVRKNGLEAHWGLAELYEKNGQYDDSIKEYDWVIAGQEEILKGFVAEKAKFAITQKEKLLKDLKSARARVEKLSKTSDFDPKPEKN